MNILGASAQGAGAGTAAIATGGVVSGSSAAAVASFAAGPFGIAIVGAAALLGALGATKGKTQHLTFDEAKKVAVKFSDNFWQPFAAKYGEAYTNDFLARELAKRMVTYLEGHYLNSGSSSMQYWIDEEPELR